MISSNCKLRAFTALFLGLGFLVIFFYCPPIIFSMVVAIAMCIMIKELKNMLNFSTKFFLLVPFYPIIPCLILMYFNQTPDYKNLLYALLALVFCFDSASYFSGKICSKFWTTTKIIPAISPGKSWEGACGGFVATTMLLCIILITQSKNIMWQMYALSAIICTIAFAGDIFESYLKRSANIKDSGTILPGHGGLLDRFDAILAVSYFFFIFKDSILQIFI